MYIHYYAEFRGEAAPINLADSVGAAEVAVDIEFISGNFSLFFFFKTVE